MTSASGLYLLDEIVLKFSNVLVALNVALNLGPANFVPTQGVAKKEMPYAVVSPALYAACKLGTTIGSGSSNNHSFIYSAGFIKIPDPTTAPRVAATALPPTSNGRTPV